MFSLHLGLHFLCFTILCLCYLFCCVRFNLFTIKPRDWLERTSPKLPILYRVGRKTLTQLECGPMPHVMAALSQSSVIPFLAQRRKLSLMPTARVPCSNVANIG